jgi:hypothetical protein
MPSISHNVQCFHSRLYASYVVRGRCQIMRSFPRCLVWCTSGAVNPASSTVYFDFGQVDLECLVPYMENLSVHTVPLLINGGSFSKASEPPLFLEEENIFQKSASVVLTGIAIELVPWRLIFEKCFHLREKGGC